MGILGRIRPVTDPTVQADPAVQALPRVRQLLMLEFGDRKDFDDPRLEWRRLFSELLGTFALVLVAAGGGILHAQGADQPRRGGRRARA